MRRALAVLAIGGLVALTGCSDEDDGAEVRNVGEEDGGSASGSESGSASGSGSGSGSASGSAVACAPVGDPAAADTTIDVELDEWSVTAPTSVAAGAVHLAAANVGDEPHEVVVVQADSIEALPALDGEGVDEAQLPDGALLGEIEAFPAGETCDGVFDLTPGTYVLFCNIVEEEDGEIEDHFALGMATTLTVEG